MAQQMQSKKWFWFAILFQNLFAYAICLIVYQIGSLLMGGTFGIWSLIALVLLLGMLYMLFRPDPYKHQKQFAPRAVRE